MALPPALIAALGQAATSPKVQAAAERLLRDAYGRLRKTEPAPIAAAATSDPVAQAIADLPTRDEIAAQLALMQAEAEARQRRMTLFAIIIGIGQAIVITLLLFR
jgi:hypothetical protein